MYESHFGLTALPFQVTPDAAFVFQGKAYRAAFVALREGLAAGVKVMLLTGEPGVGKTTLLHAFLASVASGAMANVYVSATDLDAETLLDRIAEALHEPRIADPIARREALLAKLRSAPTPTLLVIDEAQHLRPSAFELLETMVHGSAAESTRLQVCMLGQPELRMLLNAADRSIFRGLAGVDRHIGPLEQTEIRLYIEHRLHRAGWTGRPEFEDSAFFEIFVFTGGVPRRVNLLCNSLMIAAFLEKQSMIDAPAVSRAAAAIRSDSFPAAGDAVELEPDLSQPPLLGKPLQASTPGTVAFATSRIDSVPEECATSETQSASAEAALPERPRGGRRSPQAIVASAALVAGLGAMGVVYLVAQQRLPDAPSPVELRTIAGRRATGPVAPEVTPEGDPRAAGALPSTAAVLLPGARAVVSAPASAASAEPARAPPVPLGRASPAVQSEASCSGPAFALGLCDAENASSTAGR